MTERYIFVPRIRCDMFCFGRGRFAVMKAYKMKREIDFDILKHKIIDDGYVPGVSEALSLPDAIIARAFGIWPMSFDAIIRGTISIPVP